MSMIRFFSSNGAGASQPSEAIEYLMSPYSALSEEQRKEYRKYSYLIKKNISAGYDASALIEQRNNIHGTLRNPVPVALTSHTHVVIYAISITPHKYKYNSGVIAFADSDNQKLAVNPHIEREYRMLFEEIVFAGLPVSARLIEWVRHTHAGNVENHFVIPRIHLRTGRYFNAYPPCSASDFNVLKAFIDTKYGLEKNTAIDHQQLLGHVGPYDPQRKLKLKIYKQLELFCSKQNKRITRDSVQEFFENTEIKQLFSLKEIKQKRDYLQIFIDGKTKAIRLTGAAFQQPRKSAHTPEDLPSLHQKLLRIIQKRAKFNRERYLNDTQDEFIMIFEPKIEIQKAILSSPAPSFANKHTLADLFSHLTDKINKLLKIILNLIKGKTKYDAIRTTLIQPIEYNETKHRSPTATIQDGTSGDYPAVPDRTENTARTNGINTSNVAERSRSIADLIRELQDGIKDEREFQRSFTETINSTDSKCREVATGLKRIASELDGAFQRIDTRKKLIEFKIRNLKREHIKQPKHDSTLSKRKNNSLESDVEL